LIYEALILFTKRMDRDVTGT